MAIASTVMLMLVPMGDDIVWSTEQTVTGTEAGGTTSLTVTDEHVLFSLNEGWEYTTWIWLHVALLIAHAMFFFGYMFTRMA